MLKVFQVDIESDAEFKAITAWLTEHLGTVGVRWWYDKRGEIWDAVGNRRRSAGLKVTLDVTDEEESIVTAFALRWS